MFVYRTFLRPPWFVIYLDFLVLKPKLIKRRYLSSLSLGIVFNKSENVHKKITMFCLLKIQEIY